MRVEGDPLAIRVIQVMDGVHVSVLVHVQTPFCISGKAEHIVLKFGV